MTKKERTEHIWEYYKLHIIAAIFVTGLTAFTIFEIVGQTATYFSIVLTGGALSANNLRDFSDKLNRESEVPPGYGIEVRAIPYSVTNPRTFDFFAQISLASAVNELDIIVLDYCTFNSFTENRFLLNIAGEYGINVSDSEMFKPFFENSYTKWILAVAATTRNFERIEKFLELLE